MDDNTINDLHLYSNKTARNRLNARSFVTDEVVRTTAWMPVSFRNRDIVRSMLQQQHIINYDDGRTASANTIALLAPSVCLLALAYSTTLRDLISDENELRTDNENNVD